VQLLAQISFITVAVLVLCGFAIPVLHVLAADKSLRRRSHTAVELRDDVLLDIEEAITLIRGERKSGRAAA
jgi:hypothetical protein